MALAGAMALMSTAALADGGPSGRARVAAPAGISWSGVYAGASIGYGWNDASFQFTDNNFNFWNIAGNPGDARNGASFDMAGLIGGGHIGVSHQFGQYVLGLEGTASGGDLDRTITSPAFPASDTWRVQANWLTTAAVKLGYVITPNTMVSLKVGVATGNYQTQFIDFLTCGVAHCTGETNKTHVGFVVGAGLEHAINDVIRLGLDYTYTSLDSAAHSGITRNQGLGTTINTHNLNLTPGDMHAVSARISFWLTRDKPAAAAPLK